METKSAGRLGDILLAAGLISPEHLELALREQGQTGEKLGAILQRLGVVTEKEIARILASQAGVPHVSLREEWIQREAVELIPADFAEQERVFPIAIRGKTLVLAMANPLDLECIDAAGLLTGHYIEVVHATDGDIQAHAAAVLRQPQRHRRPHRPGPGLRAGEPGGRRPRRRRRLALRPPGGPAARQGGGAGRHRHPRRARGEGHPLPLPHRRAAAAGPLAAQGAAERARHALQDPGRA